MTPGADPESDRSIKEYFFIDHGDAFTHFLDLAKHELSKKRKHASESKLQSLLELAMRHPSSASANDPYKDDLKVGLGGSTLTEWLVKIVNVSGAFGGEEGVDAFGSAGMQEGKKEKQQGADKTTLQGKWQSRLCFDHGHDAESVSRQLGKLSRSITRSNSHCRSSFLAKRSCAINFSSDTCCN